MNFQETLDDYAETVSMDKDLVVTSRRERRRDGSSFPARVYGNAVAFAEGLQPWAHFPILLLSALMLALGVGTVFFSPLGFFAGAWLEAAALLLAGLVVTGMSWPVFVTTLRRMAAK